MPLQVTFTNPIPYPFASGYADVTGVQDAINAATWDSSAPNAFPPVATVKRWLAHATALMNTAMASRGYAIPLAPFQGYVVPAGEPAIQGMNAELFLHLEKIAISYAVYQLHSSRSSAGLQDDKAAMEWMKEWDDYLARLETGADNLTAYGATGPFPPQIDPSKGFDSGSLGMMNAGVDFAPDDSQDQPWFYKNLEGTW
jgi:hypothetical protein